jgi:hypothetical protein
MFPQDHPTLFCFPLYFSWVGKGREDGNRLTQSALARLHSTQDLLLSEHEPSLWLLPHGPLRLNRPVDSCPTLQKTKMTSQFAVAACPRLLIASFGSTSNLRRYRNYFDAFPYLRIPEFALHGFSYVLDPHGWDEEHVGSMIR